MCCHWATKTPTQTPLATMMCCLSSDWFIVYTLKKEAECNHVVKLNLYTRIFIALYLPLKYCIDGSMAVVNCRNMKLFLNKGSCVLIDSKGYISNTAQTYREVLLSISHSAFNVLNILMEIGYIKEWWPHIIRIIYTFWTFNSLNAYSLSKAWLHRTPTPSIHCTFSEPLTDSLLLPGTCFNFFFHDCRLPQYLSITSVISSKGLKYFCHFSSTTAFSPSCRQ